MRRFGTAIHAAFSSIVFFFFDLIDAVLCIVYEFVDEILEGKSRGCYCKTSPLHTTGENECSETLFRRKNIFREMWFLGYARKFKSKLSQKMRKSKIHESVVNRWSDCGCQSCNSWTKNEDENLHVVVKDSTSQETEDSVKGSFENVIFIHGFMGSSHFWTETVFEHIKKDRYRLLAVDLLGFGESPKPRDSLYTLRDHVETIDRSVIKPYELDSFHVVAHSMGCLVALALAAKHSNIVKSVTLVAPPYFPSSNEESVLNRIAPKRLWPPLAFGTAVMSWYEHIGRCVCFIVCKHHMIWEWLIKLCTGKRETPWKIKDITRHTHHSAWHSMHNVICDGSKFADEHLGTIINSSVEIHLIQGDRDEIVPSHCSSNMKRNFPAVEVDIVAGANHDSMISGTREEFAEKLASIWCSRRTVMDAKIGTQAR
ncbi:probable lysophospholipase BODYGUARD 4 isoform X1 [Capsella rubella]|uniref:probable lysophospholipase BODYGUARD 4 isoform X1 n=1 Tax=Capsella rubella TaxID=81985 RepID=UPI000CD50422|nr:probable lysophospholipase BODYGUARD 4 isoform X1 [Capsella rubella]